MAGGCAEGRDRLDKILAGTGRWSRKEVRELVRRGRVAVNGVPARSPEEKYERAGLTLQVDGELISGEACLYLMLHKPAGILSATEDPRAETVLDLLPEHLRRVGLFPAGRLVSPRSHVDKVYFVRTDGAMTKADAEVFRAGMVLPDGLHCMPAGLAILEPPDTGLVTLREGKYHQIKRMMDACGKPVIYLKRLSMGPLHLDESLKPGTWRPLTCEEIAALRASVSAPRP